jgi:hypothetical protein
VFRPASAESRQTKCGNQEERLTSGQSVFSLGRIRSHGLSDKASRNVQMK